MTSSNRIALLAIICSLLTLPVIAQETFDKVLMLSGEQKIGHVTALDDETVSFVHQGETLTYKLKKEDINKIEFASGRIEFMNKDAQGPVQNNPDEGITLQDHHNVIAVLPYSYVSNVSGGNVMDKMDEIIQAETIRKIKEVTRQFTVQDQITTNAQLKKNGIDFDNITSYTPGEIAHILNAEYVIYGTVNIMETGASTSSGNYFNAKDKNKRVTGFNVGSSSTSIQYETNIEMNVYNDHGESIYSKAHESFWQSNDAYKVTIPWLIKRSPFYSK